MNLDQPLGEYFTLREFVTSQTAARRGYRNEPTPAQVESLRTLCVEVLDPVRRLAGGPLIVSSGFRSPDLNRAIGGSATSQHCRGEAADVFCPYLSAEDLFVRIRESGIEADQVIQEFGQWVHISYTRRFANRREFLIATKRNGATIYKHLR